MYTQDRTSVIVIRWRQSAAWNNKVVMALDISMSQTPPHSTEGRSIKVSLKVIFHVINQNF